MFGKLKKSQSSKTLGTLNYQTYDNNYKDTNYLTSRCFLTPSLVLISGDNQCMNQYSNEKVVVKITNTYVEIMEKTNLVVIKTFLLRDVKEFIFNGQFWEIICRNSQGEFVTYSFNVSKAHILQSKVMEFLKQVQKEEDHNSEFIPKIVY
ncbi:hypothetical protein DDB_G0288389 [Dictyostelium discoideum AX4]|uniref:Uncharacterized protein n=1 Tax=Dictyostelium discoideum TaxID=44689 RepID=Q54J06_DICDI|nr:hypothetical protein DDB_G0288389 [Dictyostelium discoideum AX4]EAL63220.1 hypothetical protein DDB_G0288389 [Dictyostelium discoideum AX4]|eukprot:XP_636724.1 hypothetical protein DDB_G0288389 [Dictyostelium discoideum AX4]